MKLIYTQDEAFGLVEEYTEEYKKKIKELEKENRSLKKEKGKIRQRLIVLEKNLETLSRVKENKELREENRNLKSDLAFERTMLDNVRAEYESLQNVNKNLKEKIETLELWLDNKEKLNEEYRKQIDKYKKQYQHSMGFSDFGGYDE